MPHAIKYPRMTRWRTLATWGFWMWATPAVLPVSGFYIFMPVWWALGAVALLAQYWARQETLGRLMPVDLPWGRALAAGPALPLWAVVLWGLLSGLFFAIISGGLLVLIQFAMGGWAVAGCLAGTALLAVLLYWGALQTERGFALPPAWKVALPLILFWMLRTQFGGQTHPNAFTGWIMCLLLWFAGSRLRVPPALVFAAVINTALPALLVEWYVAPMNRQVARVAAHPQVRLVRHDPELDFRWLQQGCRPGEYWMGTRSMTGLSQNKTTLQHNNKGYLPIGSTADNGVVDCAMHLVLVGDFNKGGQLYVLDERTRKILSHSRLRTLVSSGLTGLIYHPGLAWIIAGYESNRLMVWLDVRNPQKPVQHDLPLHGSHMAFCRSATRPCFYSTVQTGEVRKHFGKNFSQVIEVKRRGRSLAPDVLLDEDKNLLYVSDVITGRIEIFSASTLKAVKTLYFPPGPPTAKSGGRIIWMAGCMRSTKQASAAP